jgi:chitinase
MVVFRSVKLCSFVVVAGLLAMMTAACSGGDDDSSPVAPTPEEPKDYDVVTVTFNTLTAHLDCDGPDNPGDFDYRMNVDTLDSEGH